MNPLKLEIAAAAGTAVRVGALFMAVIVFATMWDSDAKPEHSNHWLAHRAEQRVRPVEHGGGSNSRGALSALKTQQIAAQIELPQDITAGQYLVADTWGQVRRVHVTRSMASSTSPARDQYTLREGDSTTYFIRIRGENKFALAGRDEKRRN
jgi:hypothetical protein